MKALHGEKCLLSTSALNYPVPPLKWQTFIHRFCGYTKKTIKIADFPYYSPEAGEGAHSGSLLYCHRKC